MNEKPFEVGETVYLSRGWGTDYLTRSTVSKATKTLFYVDGIKFSQADAQRLPRSDYLGGRAHRPTSRIEEIFAEQQRESLRRILITKIKVAAQDALQDPSKESVLTEACQNWIEHVGASDG